MRRMGWMEEIFSVIFFFGGGGFCEDGGGTTGTGEEKLGQRSERCLGVEKFFFCVCFS